jgi:hypothetical protein
MKTIWRFFILSLCLTGLAFGQEPVVENQGTAREDSFLAGAGSGPFAMGCIAMPTAIVMAVPFIMLEHGQFFIKGAAV